MKPFSLPLVLSCLCGSVLAVTHAAAQGPVAISEFLADNERGIEDEDGDHSDWIEILNSSDEAVDLAGYALTDDASALQKWVLPSEVLGAGRSIVVFASGENRAQAGSELHTNFSIDADGGYLALVAPDGVTVLSEFSDYPKQRTDVSYGAGGGRPVVEKVVSDGDQWRWLVPDGEVPGWQDAAFDDGLWETGRTGFGYETGSGYENFLGAGGDVDAEMFNFRSSIYLRRDLALDLPGPITGLNLRVRYDDGFIAYLNGRQVAAANDPLVVTFDALARTQHNDSEAIQWEETDLTQHLDVFDTGGEHVIAVHGLNAALDSSDFLLSVELEVTYLDETLGLGTGYLPVPTPGALNGESFVDFVSDTKFSVGRGFFTSDQEVAITTATEGATIRYTTDGSEPTAGSGMVYSGPIQVSSTTILRAAAFFDGWVPTNIDTQTYVFANDVVRQQEMDSTVVNSVAYRGTIRSDLSTNLPALSLVVDDGDFFGAGGIYTNFSSSGRAAEVPVSVEFFDPIGGEEFQVDAGVRIHGGNARSHPKKPMRLYFREEYGDRKLKFPLFDDIDVEEFDQLILRGGGHDSWSLANAFGTDDTDLPPHGTLLRDQFLRKTEREMGILSPSGRYVHVYINGSYWGVYDLHERANADYFSSHLGGDSEDWDVLHHPQAAGNHTVVDGDDVAWNELMGLLQAGVSSDAEYRAIADLLEIDDYIDHLIVRMWSGDYDWCGPIFRGGTDVGFFGNKNWYAGRQGRNGDSGGFRFFTWDAEMSMGLHLLFNLNPFAPPPDQRVTDFDMTRADDIGSPVFPYSVLKSWPEFQRRFGDRLYRHFFNDGVMAVANNRTRLAGMESELEEAIVGESARWGDEGAVLLLRDVHWRDEVNWLRNTFLRVRNSTLLGQFRAEGLYPGTEPPLFNQYGGEVDPGFPLTMSAAGGVIYYTNDGSDPYDPPVLSTTVLVDESSAVAVLVPSPVNGGSALGTTWTDVADPANIGQWEFGTNGVGYDYPGLVNVDVGAMEDVNGSVFIRIPFTIASQEDLDSFDELLLKMMYDDGFVAYLNGEEVEWSNDPAVLAWNSIATDNRPDAQAVTFATFDLTIVKDKLQVGANMLAIHGLNDGEGSSDLLMTARLEGVTGSGSGGVSASAIEYDGAVVLETTQEVKARTRSASGEWSALAEATFLVGPLGGADNLRISEIHYRPLGPVGDEELAAGSSRSDFEFLELVNFSGEAIDLTGVSFGAGISWSFDSEANFRSLGAGERLLLVANREAFLARYGNGLAGKIAGEFRDGTRLANGGEWLRLLAADGAPIHEVRYGDSAPWPVGPDGNGPSLVLVDPAGATDPGSVWAWGESVEPGGSPGEVGEVIAGAESYASWRARVFDPGAADFETVSAPGFDADGDGVDNVFEYLSGRNPLVAEGGAVLEPFVTPDGSGVTYRRLNGLAAPIVEIEVSADLSSWEVFEVAGVETVVDHGDGTETVMVPLSEPGSTVQGVRLRVNVEL